MKRWKQSLEELKDIRVLVCCGMLAALALALSLVASIDLGPYVRIGFSSVPNRVVDDLFGPVVGMIFGAILDILKLIIKPTGPYFPGFTLTAMMGSVIFGGILYRRKLTITRVLVAQLLLKVICNVCMNSLWLKLLYGQALLALLPSRLLSNAIMLPIDTLICYLVLRLLRPRISRLLGWKLPGTDTQEPQAKSE
ncbi:MAG: folate family ECF transporter S component [Butyrivibrio sp.]|nr:folate family ECF transporter S component [Butyrivibrio sp.]